MKEKDDIRRELEDLAPGFPARPDFVSPTGYFEQNPDRLLNHWRVVKRQTHVNIFRRCVAVAALVTGLVIGLFCWRQQTPADTPLPQISSADAYAYVHENITEFQPYIDAAFGTISIDSLELQPADAEQYILEEFDDAELEQLF